MNEQATFAIPPEGIRCRYLTAGRRYRANLLDDAIFAVVDDQGDTIVCLWNSCAHLGHADWQREEVPVREAEASRGDPRNSADLLSALKALRDELSGSRRPNVLLALLANADLVIAKAEGEA